MFIQHTARYCAVTAAAMAALALSSGVLPAYNSAAIASAQVLHDSPVAPVQTKVCICTEMRALWGEHLDGTRASFLAFANDTLAVPPTTERVLRNGVDIAGAFAPYYGPEVATRLTVLLTQHNFGSTPFLVATRSGDKPAADKALADWYVNAREIADLLASINPNWSQQELREAMVMHIDLTAAFGVDVLRGDYGDADATFDEDKAHMLHVADILSQGIITQFPDKF
ncbi:hypothetical protein [Nocardia pseudobrasiliensis]|uniref:Uncharacterized protein n=1 Tax=Nocardia pseudobrasiliensis TaxID=45979 RepID=A0A370HWK1_9NOCA|nr:hypothetical protein [Nocardia pseudobrasiliensis]RDI61334.1 hypothetical protein DFR76_11459 [Nocardia pseudobrasiliensis]